MKVSALRRWLREERTREHTEWLAGHELPPPPTATSWFCVDEQGRSFRWYPERAFADPRAASCVWD